MHLAQVSGGAQSTILPQARQNRLSVRTHKNASNRMSPGLHRVILRVWSAPSNQ